MYIRQVLNIKNKSIRRLLSESVRGIVNYSQKVVRNVNSRKDTKKAIEPIIFLQ